ncbi:MAG: Outer membrane protein OprM [Chlamydiales bacterium]|nr:Outer membrane protein OprM [Chlamydiales bacterium]MCH9635332.1 Outer membrane protein OprM [Chlamydiales bacterium]
MNDPLCQPSLEKTSTHTIENPHFVQGDWPDENWWEMFNSPKLNSIVIEALEANPDILAIEAKICQAKASSTVSRAQVFPLVFFDADENLSYVSRNGLIHALNPARTRHTDEIHLDLSINYEVDLFWKYHNLFYATLGQLQAEIAEAAQVKLIVSTAIVQAYFALKTNLVRQELYHRLLDVRQDYYDVDVLLLEEALSSGFEPALSEEKMQEAQKAVYEIDQLVLNNIHLINILRGKGPDEELIVDKLPLEPPESIAIPDTLSVDLLARRPDLAAQLWRTKALGFEIKARIADFYPSVNIKQILGLSSLNWSNLFQSGSLYPAFQPALHLPIFVWGEIKAGVDQKTAEYNQAIEEYNMLVLKSTQQVADLLVILDAVYKKRDAQRDILQSAHYRFDLSSLNFEQGLGNILQVYDKEVEWIEKALVDVELIYAQYATSVGLVRSLGGGYQS